MKFSLKKYSAFTVGELMIMLSVLTVLLAAFAPVFTVRYNNASSDYVWQYVPDSEEFDSYSNPLVDALTAQSFIGITPASKTMVTEAVKSGSNVLYSKVIIRPSNYTFNSEVQKTIQFRYGDDMKGQPVATLYANKENILLGGKYKKLTATAGDNTAFGRLALEDLTSGYRNTALGYYAGKGLNSNTDNTVIESRRKPAESVKGSSNTFVNVLSTDDNASGSISGSNNVVISTLLSLGSRNTYISPSGVSDKSLSASSSSDDNTVLGGAFTKNVSYTGNTIVGYGAGFSGGSGSSKYNTVIGSYAGTGMNNSNKSSGLSGSYKTCIGYNSCIPPANGSNSSILSDEKERIFIGGYRGSSNDQVGIAPLEVHNVSGRTNSPLLDTNVGNSSVLINGNLIIRGQSYFTTKSQGNSLMGFMFIKPQPSGLGRSSKLVYMADDFYDNDLGGGAIKEECGGRCQGHAASAIASSGCVCVHPCTSATGKKCDSFAAGGYGGPGITSYDWVSGGSSNWDCMSASDPTSNIKSYYDKSVSRTFYQGRYEVNKAHTLSGSSCCPDLRSDIRLKNLSGKFVDNLDAIRSINAYNYTFISDSEKRPQVGVMAQDLKLIFPNAVTKDENGYYQIRWDEMLYAAVNAIKALNEKVVKLAQRVINDKERISALKKDNAGLVKRLDVLSAELSVLEAQKK